MKNLRIYVIIAVLVFVGVVWYFFFQTKVEPVEPIETTEEALEVLSEAPPATIETNPVKKVPDLNPVEKVNPFKTSNPFE